jgi:LuxS protein involved in autoinducer AI2 synthesis
MQRIKSFEVDHTKIDKGMYISRIDGDIVTYDIRMVKPNTPPYLHNGGIHTFEHLFATYSRNSKFGSHIVYVGPMGCLTGFYLLTRDLSHEDAILMVNESMNFIAEFSGEIPGVSIEECGNFKEHNLAEAKSYGAMMHEVLKNWTPNALSY